MWRYIPRKCRIHLQLWLRRNTTKGPRYKHRVSMEGGYQINFTVQAGLTLKHCLNARTMLSCLIRIGLDRWQRFSNHAKSILPTLPFRELGQANRAASCFQAVNFSNRNTIFPNARSSQTSTVQKGTGTRAQYANSKTKVEFNQMHYSFEHSRINMIPSKRQNIIFRLKACHTIF